MCCFLHGRLLRRHMPSMITWISDRSRILRYLCVHFKCARCWRQHPGTFNHLHCYLTWYRILDLSSRQQNLLKHDISFQCPAANRFLCFWFPLQAFLHIKRHYNQVWAETLDPKPRLKSAVSLKETVPKTIPSLIKTQSLASKGQDVCRSRNFWFLQELTIGWSRGLGAHRSIHRLTLIHAHISDPTNEHKKCDWLIYLFWRWEMI